MLVIKELLPGEPSERVLLSEPGEEGPAIPTEFHSQRLPGLRLPILQHRLEHDLMGRHVHALRSLAIGDITEVPATRALPAEHVRHEEGELRLVEPGFPPEHVPIPG